MTTTDQALDAANSMITAMRQITQEEHQELARLRAEVHRLQADSSRAIAALAECIGERDRMREALVRILNFPIHSEPLGSAYAMSDLANAALKGETK